MLFSQTHPNAKSALTENSCKHMQTDLTSLVRKPCSQAVLIRLQDFQPRFSELMIEKTVFSVLASVFRTLHRLVSPSRTLAKPPIPNPSPHLPFILTPGLVLCMYSLELHVLRDGVVFEDFVVTCPRLVLAKHNRSVVL
jgi:hypothetical protein